MEMRQPIYAPIIANGIVPAMAPKNPAMPNPDPTMPPQIAPAQIRTSLILAITTVDFPHDPYH